MKKSIFTLAICLSIIFVNAQITRQATFRLNFPNANDIFFKNYPNINRVLIVFKQQKPVSLSIYHNSAGQKNNTNSLNNKEVYDLGFVGDRYLLEKRYKSFNWPIVPSLNIEYLQGTSKLQQNRSYYDTEMLIVKDSVSYTFNSYQHTDNQQITLFNDSFNETKYTANINELAHLMERSINRQNIKHIADSVLIFRGLVNVDGKLSDIKLVNGESSLFTKVVLNHLQNDSKPWRPAHQNVRPVKTYAGIYVKLNTDKTITIATSGNKN